MNLKADTVEFERAMLRNAKTLQQFSLQPIIRALRAAGAVMNRHLAKSLKREGRGS
ncbi:hypothetical protein [Planctomyces sp. SH-PL14]|uniref:hypothetical protein n=1 Tax=Planctomyces sp. SH-PL14 TaxID=1632864 RepID=UPI00078C2657|nr:hypothetical protein [Planctomyces sp. SH-PL14]AMV16595.1 hypothetical protein VT03_01815 [Planctomyces sp. SH-PL14]